MGTPTLISSVQRALHLLEAAAAHEDGASAKRLARETGLPLGTTYHLLRTLVHEGYLHKREDGGFVLGDSLGELHEQGQAQSELSRVRPALTALRDELDMATYLARFEDGEVRILDIADGPRAPRVHRLVDPANAAHASALGRCVLRQLDADTRDDYLARHPPFELTPRTVTRARDVLRGLAESAPHALVWDDQQYELGTGCVAAPVTDGDAPAALAVSYGIGRRGQAEAATGRLLWAARAMSYTLSLTI